MTSNQANEVVEWLKERRLNCLRIAATKIGADKAGCESDAAYFREAVMLILGITDQDVYETRTERSN
jgi:hypothetical protein